MTDTAASQFVDLIHGLPLARRDSKTLDFVPHAAKAWSVSDDKLTYRFTLRDDLRWSDGTPLTAEDYAWTFKQANDPANKYPYRNTLDRIASYVAPDPTTIVVTVKDPIVIGFERAMSAVSYPLPKHIWQSLDWGDPTKNAEIMKPSVSAGMWTLGEWQRDDRITLRANERYLNGRPKLDAYAVRIVPNPSVGYQMLKKGEIDVLSPQPVDYKEARTLPNVEMFDWQPAAPSWQYLGFNFRREHVKDVAVRRALSHAIDRQGIIEAVFEGLARPTYSTFPPTHWTYNPNVPKYEHDLARARALLKDAGYTAGGDGVLQKGGRPLRLKLLFGPTSSKVREAIATIAQQAFKEIGVALEVVGMEFNAFTAAITNEATEWDINVLGWSGVLEPDGYRVAWMEPYIPALNAGGYRNKRVDELFDLGLVEFDRDKRKAIYQEIQQIVSEDAAYVFLCYNLGYVAVNRRIGGVRATPLGIAADEGMLGWFVR